jgi:hypothetical protein
MQPKLSRKSQLSIKISRRLKMGLLVQKFADRMGEKRGAGHLDFLFTSCSDRFKGGGSGVLDGELTKQD